MYATRFLDLPPLRQAAGTVKLPGSKSISNRALLLAGLSTGVTSLHGVLDADDTRVMLDALRQLGCDIQRDGSSVRVTGIEQRLGVASASLFLGNAGTAMRPLAAALALLAARDGGRFDLGGVPRMHERPIGDLVDALRRIGCSVDYLGQPGFPPLRIGPARAAIRLDTPVRVRGDVSSQFLSALLLALPLASQAGPIEVEVDGELISKPYVDLTLRLLARFGVAVERDGWRRFAIPADSAYRSPGTLQVEADASSASYFIALGAIAATGAPVRIEGVGLDSIQGDMAFVEPARAMGAVIDGGPGWLEVRRGTWPLRAIDLDANAIPDAAMTLAVMALYAEGTTRLSNIASWRVKETDRIAAMAAELRRLGAGVVEGDDFIVIAPPTAWRAASVRTYDDHRMAMCFALAAFNPLATDAAVPVRILEPACVSKTYPAFFETLFAKVSTTTAEIPVIAIDGPTASGKGTVASAVAKALGYHFLDSGAVYRATALAAMRAGIAADDEPGLATVAARLDLRFANGGIRLGDDDVTEQLRLEEVGALASKVSAWPAVRAALRELQLAFRRIPGLVADGRDMGTVIFPGADLKIFLTASAATRAERRYRQLIAKGLSANIDSLRSELEARDARDRTRSVSPLEPAADAVLLDSSALSIEASVAAVLEAWQRRRPFQDRVRE